MDFISQFFIDFINILNEMSPYLMLGFLFAGILKVSFPQRFIDRYLGQRTTRSVFNASLIGIPLPLCSCGVIPTGISFYKSGASKGSAVSFLISTPQTGVDSILVTYSLLGLPFAIIRPFIALFTGVIGGMLTNRSDNKQNRIKTCSNTKCSDTETCNETLASSQCSCDDSSCGCEQKDTTTANSSSISSKIHTMFKYAFVDFLQDISKWLVIGLMLAAFISVLIPDDFFSRFIGNDLIGMIIILIASIPLYICATSSVPVAAILMMKGISPGAALVFLMAGPATNAATLTVLNKVLGRKTALAYLVSIIGGALFFGLLIDNVLPREWFDMKGLHAHMQGHEGHFELPLWLKWGCSVTLSALILNGFWRKQRTKKQKFEYSPINTQEMENQKIVVIGMSCNHCKMSVEKHIGAMENIELAEVNLEQKLLNIKGNNIEIPKIKREIESLGFEFGGVKE